MTQELRSLDSNSLKLSEERDSENGEYQNETKLQVAIVSEFMESQCLISDVRGADYPLKRDSMGEKNLCRHTVLGLNARVSSIFLCGNAGIGISQGPCLWLNRFIDGGYGMKNI